MFINPDVVAIAFRIINFLLLIGLASFIFKKYLKDSLLLLIAQKKSEYNCLLTQQTTLEKQQSELDALLKKELQVCKELRVKIDEWKKIVILEREAKEQQNIRALEALKKRHATIALNKENERVKNIVAQAIVGDLEKSLSLYFEDQKKNTEYLDAIVHFMDERIS